MYSPADIWIFSKAFKVRPRNHRNRIMAQKQKKMCLIKINISENKTLLQNFRNIKNLQKQNNSHFIKSFFFYTEVPCLPLRWILIAFLF